MTGSGGAISTDGSRTTFDAWPATGVENQVWLREWDIAAVNTDLTLENVTIWPAQIKRGQPFDVTVTVRNTGAAGHFVVDLYVDPATTPVLCDAGEGGWDGAEVISLEAGGSYTFTRHHDGLAAAGSHALYVQVDSACEIDETSESNNLPAPTGITVLDADYSPDLAVTGVTVIPAAPRPGQTISYQVAVQSLGDATSATSVGLYLDAAPAACPDTPVLTADLPRLEAGASTTVTLVQTLGLTAGTYAAYARVDDSCQITETNESNNTTPDPGVGFTVSGEQAYPDLVVESSAASPGIIVAGEPITVSAIVRNDGAGGAATSSVFLYVNHAPAGCGDDGFFDAVEIPSLAAGDAATVTYTFVDGFAEGTYTLHPMANAYCDAELIEEDYTNNVGDPVVVTVTDDFDLVVDSITTTPAVLDPDEPFSVTVTIKNLGPAPAGGLEAAFYTYIGDCAWTGAWGACWDEQGSTQELAAGATESFTVAHPGWTYGGEHALYGRVDPQDGSDESDETNNDLTVYVTVSGNTPTPTAIADGDAYADGHPDGHSDEHPNEYADSDQYTRRDQHPDAYADADGDCHTHGDLHADGDPISRPGDLQLDRSHHGGVHCHRDDREGSHQEPGHRGGSRGRLSLSRPLPRPHADAKRLRPDRRDHADPRVLRRAGGRRHLGGADSDHVGAGGRCAHDRRICRLGVRDRRTRRHEQHQRAGVV